MVVLPAGPAGRLLQIRFVPLFVPCRHDGGDHHIFFLFQVKYKKPTPPDEELILRSRSTSVDVIVITLPPNWSFADEYRWPPPIVRHRVYEHDNPLRQHDMVTVELELYRVRQTVLITATLILLTAIIKHTYK